MKQSTWTFMSLPLRLFELFRVEANATSTKTEIEEKKHEDSKMEEQFSNMNNQQSDNVSKDFEKLNIGSEENNYKEEEEEEGKENEDIVSTKVQSCPEDANKGIKNLS